MDDYILLLMIGYISKSTYDVKAFLWKTLEYIPIQGLKGEPNPRYMRVPLTFSYDLSYFLGASARCN